jgi:hypothetical protein
LKKSPLAIQRHRAATKSLPSAPDNGRRLYKHSGEGYYARRHYGILAQAGRFIVCGNNGKQGCHVGAV